MSKIRMKLGNLEVEYEGEDQFIKDSLEQTLEKFVGFCKSHPEVLKATSQSGGAPNMPTMDLGDDLGTTRTIAAKLNVKSGPELVVAAAAFLTFNEKKAKFTRQELSEAMKGATGYFQKNYIKNLSQYLKSVIDNQQLVEISSETYALHQTELKKLGERLAN